MRGEVQTKKLRDANPLLDEIHGYRTWNLLEAMQLDPRGRTR